MSISVIVPTLGRPTLYRTIQSIVGQLEHGDELIIELDYPAHKDDGNHARDKAVSRSTGSHLWFIDDDDEAMPGALAAFRRAIAIDPDAAWIFKMKIDGQIVWNEKKAILPGNQGTPCFLVPRSASPKWDHFKGATEWHYIERVVADKRWADDIVATIRPIHPGE